MQELLAQSSFDKLKEGTIVSGVITEIRQNEVVVDIGGKAEGVIPANEFFDLGELQVGSTIEVLLERLEDKEGNPILSYEQAQQKKNWENILQKCQEGAIVSGRVKTKVSERMGTTFLTVAQHGLVGDMKSPVDVTYLADTVMLLRYFEAQPFAQIGETLRITEV